MLNIRHRIGILIGLCLLLFACGNNSNDTEGDRVPLSALKLSSGNCSQLKAYISQSLIKQYTDETQFYYCASRGGGGGSPVIDLANSPNSSAETTSSADASPTGVSQTNNQEAGVNEADIIKSDRFGNLFMIRGNYLIVANAFPPQTMHTVDTIDLGSSAQGIYLYEGTISSENRLVVITQDMNYYILPALEGLSILPPNPEVMKLAAHFYQLQYDQNNNITGVTRSNTISLEGTYQTSRQIDNRLHIVSRYYLRPRLLLDSDTTINQLRQDLANAVYEQNCGNSDNQIKIEALKLQISQRIETIIDAVSLTEVLPKAQKDNVDINNFLNCEDVHIPQATFNYGLQVITSIDIDGNNIGATASTNNAWISYASKDHLYLAQPSYGWWWSSQQSSQTAIYKFKLGPNKPQYVSTGSVDGRVLNQFSFSEYQDHLRVATTEDAQRFVFIDPNRPVSASKNHLFVMTETSSGELSTVGSVRNFAIGETIRSVRFLQDKGFVVTFRNIDPLFSFDLSTPFNPRIRSELKIPGFSTYMHPFGENYLITIGREGNDTNTGIGNDFQLRLIDISDLSNLRVVKSYTPPDLSSYSWSAAEYDHKAFTFYAPRNLLAIPARIYSQTSSAFNGVLVFRVDPNFGSKEQGGFIELGRIDHKDLAYDAYCSGANLYTPCVDFGYIYWAAPMRTVVMTGTENQVEQEYLFTMSEAGLKASNVLDINTSLNSILFPPYQQPPIILY